MAVRGDIMAHVQDGSSLRQSLLIPQLAYDPNYGGIIGISESMRPGAGAVNVDPSDLHLATSEDSDYQEVSPSMAQRELPDKQDSASPGGDPAPEPVYRPLVPVGEEEEEEEEEKVCKCCTSWYDWCLFLSCKLTILRSPQRMPLRERKCLRRARTEGWRLLWSLVLPLAVGSVPLQLVWVIAQLIASLALFGTSVADCVSNEWNNQNVVCVSVSGTWMLLTLVDSIVCLGAVQLYQNKFVWKISPYITVIRIIYTVICLHIVVMGFNFSAGIEFEVGNVTYATELYCDIKWTSKNIQLSKANFAFSVVSLAVFVDFILLVVGVQFTCKSLRLRITQSQPKNKAEGLLLLFHTGFELTVHLLLVFSTFYATLPQRLWPFYYCYDLEQVSCCEQASKWYLINTGVYAGLSIVVPLWGISSVYFIDYFWFQEYLASIYLSVQSILQDRETVARLGIPENVSEGLQERSQGVSPELLKKSITNFFKNKVTFTYKILHLCENPFSVVYSFFLFCILLPWFMIASLQTPLVSSYSSSQLPPTGLIAALMVIIVHLRAVVVIVIFLPIFIILFLILPVLSCLMCVCLLPAALLSWPLYSSLHCCSTHNCKRDLVP